MPIHSSYQSRKRLEIGARGPLQKLNVDNTERGLGGFTFINSAVVVCWVMLMITASTFYHQTANVNSDKNKLALGVPKDDDTPRTFDASGLITMRDDTTVQCDPQKVNAQWLRSSRESDLRLRCVPTAVDYEQTADVGLLLQINDSFEGLAKLAYDGTANGANSFKSMTATDEAAWQAGTAGSMAPLKSCSKSLSCSPGYKCVLIPKAPVRCNPAIHTRCRCSFAKSGHFTLLASTAQTIDDATQLVDYSKITAANANGNSNTHDKADLGKSDLCYSSNIEDMLISGFKHNVAVGGTVSHRTALQIATSTTPMNAAQDLCSGAEATADGSGGAALTNGLCLADMGDTYAGKADIVGHGIIGTAGGIATLPETSRRLNTRHHKHAGAREHNLVSKAYDCEKHKDTTDLCMSNGERLHNALFGKSSTWQLTQGQGGPTMLIVIFSAISSVIGLLVMAVHLAAKGSYFGTAQAWADMIIDEDKWPSVILSVVTNMLDFATDICVLLLLQRARYNNDIDFPFAASGAWLEAGCYDSNEGLGYDVDHEQNAGEFGGDSNLVWLMFATVCVRFFLYRVLGTTLFSTNAQV